MIIVDFLVSPDGYLEGFRATGHSELAEEGTDILCAAVSSAVYMTLNTVTDVLNVTPLSLRVNEDETFMRVEKNDTISCMNIFQGLKIHLLNLEEQYPKNLKVSYVEV